VRRMREARSGEDLDIFWEGLRRERMRLDGAEQSEEMSVVRWRKTKPGGRTDEDTREREGVLAEPVVERLCDVSRELEVLLLIFSDRNVGGSDATMGKTRKSA
jgi:hypothetical protein